MGKLLFFILLLNSTLSYGQEGKPTGGWEYVGYITYVNPSTAPAFTVTTADPLIVGIEFWGESAGGGGGYLDVHLYIDSTLVYTYSNSSPMDGHHYTDNVYINKALLHAGEQKLILVTGDSNVRDLHVVFPTAVTEVQGQGIAAVVVPNPSSGQATLSVNTAAADELAMSITDVMGRVCYATSVRVERGENAVALPAMQRGSYFVSLRNKAGDHTELIRWMRE